jgi:cytochrome c556
MVILSRSVAATLMVGALCAAACSTSSSAPPATQQTTAVQKTAGGTALIGPMKPVVSVKELMRYTIDPLADNIFDAVTWDISKKGTIQTEPKTDDDWEKVRVGAITLAEGIYLLKVPRPFTPAGDVNNSTGPNPPELSPTQIKAKVDTDPVLWEAKIEALRNAALEVFDIANKKDSKALFEASEDLDMACEACHLEYWYPGDRAAVDDDARQRARFEKSARKNH